MLGRVFAREPRGWRSKPLDELLLKEEAYQVVKGTLDELIETGEVDQQRLQDVARRVAELWPYHDLYLSIRQMSRDRRELMRLADQPDAERDALLDQIATIERNMTRLVETFMENYSPHSQETQR